MKEARDGSGNLLNQYFKDGQTISSTNYFYTRDHLGSVRELTDSSGAIQAQYSYDSYGRVSKIQGTLASDWQYSGYYFHGSSGLSLATYRAYSSTLGRWINRDPIQEQAGSNLYLYCGDAPIRRMDLSGLDYLLAPGGYSYDPTRNNCLGYATGIGYLVTPGQNQKGFKDFIPSLPGNIRCYSNVSDCSHQCGPGRHPFWLDLFDNKKRPSDDPWSDPNINFFHAYVPCPTGGFTQIFGDNDVNTEPGAVGTPPGSGPDFNTFRYCCCSDFPPKGPSGCAKK